MSPDVYNTIFLKYSIYLSFHITPILLSTTGGFTTNALEDCFKSKIIRWVPEIQSSSNYLWIILKHFQHCFPWNISSHVFFKHFQPCFLQTFPAMLSLKHFQQGFHWTFPVMLSLKHFQQCFLKHLQLCFLKTFPAMFSLKYFQHCFLFNISSNIFFLTFPIMFSLNISSNVFSIHSSQCFL